MFLWMQRFLPTCPADVIAQIEQQWLSRNSGSMDGDERTPRQVAMAWLARPDNQISMAVLEDQMDWDWFDDEVSWQDVTDWQDVPTDRD